MWTRVVTRAVSVLAVSCLATPVLAQSSRQEQIAEQQAAKATRLTPEAPPAGEVIVTRVMSSPLLSGSGGVYPWFGSVYSGAGFAAGVGFLHRAGRNSRVNMTAAASMNGSVAFDADWRAPAVGPTGRVQPWLDARWSRLNDVAYYGIGADTLPADRRLVDYRPREGNAGVTVRLASRILASGSYGYLSFTTVGDRTAFRRRLPALGRTTTYGIGRAGALVDWRPSPGYSTRGGFVRGDWSRYAASDSAPFSFDRFDVEVAQLVPFVREQFGLGVRALATTTRVAEGHEVPFILLPSIGSGDTVRALPNRRFHDRSRVVLNAEYRWRPSRYLDMALFVDSGSVAPRLQDITGRQFKTGYGIGGRLHGPAFTALRVDVAHGREGWNVVFAGGIPF